MKRNHEMDLTRGSIFKKLIVFALPLIFTNVLQLLFNATDIAVLGIMVNDKAVAAVGATTSIINLIVNLFIGLSVGTSVVLGKSVGAGSLERSRRIVGTATLTSLICGVILLFVGYFGAETFLIWTKCAPEILPQATKYLQIYFLGIPIILFYNFAAGMLRAGGDTFRPMIYLLISGVANVGLNVFFISVFNLTVEGVAIATVSAQGISAALSLIAMVKSDGHAKFKIKNFKIYKSELKDILKIGLPSGLQSSMFSISNVMISTTVNSLGVAYTTGSSVASQFDGFVYTMGNSFAHASMSFTSQNLGAGKLKRVKKGIFTAILMLSVLSLTVGSLVYLFSDALCGIMTSDPTVISIAKERILILCSFYWICGIMDTSAYTLRAFGKSTTAMVISLICACAFRILWLETFFLLNPVFIMIYWSYPISWVMNIVLNLVFFIPTYKKEKQRIQEEKLNQAQLA